MGKITFAAQLKKGEEEEQSLLVNRAEPKDFAVYAGFGYSRWIRNLWLGKKSGSSLSRATA